MQLFLTVLSLLYIIDWFLKDIGESMDSDAMKKAKKFILEHGGI